MNPIKEYDVTHHCLAISKRNCSETPRNFLTRAILAGILFAPFPLLAHQAPPTVMAGARLRVQFNNEVSTANSRLGDGVEVHLLKPVEAEGREVLPVGTILTGHVLAVRKGVTHRKVVPVLRLAFEQLRLPDGRTFPTKASIADLGVSESIDSEGTVSTAPSSKSKDAADVATSAGIGAGVGAIAGGGSGAAKGAGIGAGITILGDLLTRNDAYWDFTLKRGRKVWLRLDADLTLTPSLSPANEKTGTKGPSESPQLPQAPATALASSAPAKTAGNGAVYVEPAPKARFYRVDSEALLRDLNKAGIPLTINQSQADNVLRVSHDSHGFHAHLTDRNGNIAYAGSAQTQGGLTRGVISYFREHAATRRRE
jgi:hypothetical protein